MTRTRMFVVVMVGLAISAASLTAPPLPCAHAQQPQAGPSKAGAHGHAPGHGHGDHEHPAIPATYANAHIPTEAWTDPKMIARGREIFAAKCASYLRHGIGVVIVDIVTSRSANLHEEMFRLLEVKTRRPAWESPTGLYAVAYRPVTVRKKPRVEVWPETLKLGKVLPVMPLWLRLDLCVPVSQGQVLYQALADAGVETELVVYPREGHGWREREHQLDGHS